MESDFYFRNESNIVVLFPKSASAQKWVLDNLSLEIWQDPNQMAIEPRLFDEVVAGILLEGLTISASGTIDKPC
jgi:hypothetical protein